MIPTAEVLNKGLIVSVQAPLGSPMRDPDVIASMAEASLRNGAVGVRLESPEHIGAVRRRCPEALIIGLWKCTFPDSSAFSEKIKWYAWRSRSSHAIWEIKG
jgi:N-acylglucosamine-6-phosphate 2-epimerase